ncbi:hypothetical protein [Fervidobacterium sp.]
MRKLGILIAVVLFGLVVCAQQVDLDSLLSRIELLEEYTNMIYDALGTKASTEDLDMLLENINALIDELQPALDDMKVALDIHDSDILKIYDTLGMLSEEITKLQEMLEGYVDKETLSGILDRIDLLEEYTNMIYEILENKASVEDLNVALENVMGIIDEFQPILEDIKVTLDIHDSDILKIYDTLGMLSEEIAEIKEFIGLIDLSLMESLALKLDMHDQDIVNIYDNLSAKADREQVDALEEKLATIEEDIAGLSEILSGLAAQIGDTDYLLRKAIENTQKDLQAKIDTKASKEDVEVVLNRVDLLEEYANILYETLGTKASVDELEMLMAELDERILAIETDVLNIRSTIETGLPALRDMLYELSANLAAVEDRLTSYVEVSVAAVKDETKAELEEIMIANMNALKEEIESTIAKNNETFSSAIMSLNEEVNTLQAKVDTKADAKAVEEKVNNVNIIAWLGVVLGAVALVLPFVMGQ